MRAFEVKAGTTVLVIEDGKEWFSYNFVEHECKNDNLFFLEDIVVDPVGKLGACREHFKTIGGAYAKARYYGFHRNKWTLLVPMGDVIVH